MVLLSTSFCERGFNTNVLLANVATTPVSNQSEYSVRFSYRTTSDTDEKWVVPGN